MVKVKVHVNGKPIGWMRAVSVVADNGTETEVLVSPSLAKATAFDENGPASRQAMALYMAKFIGPERTTSKSPEPVVTFQLVRV